MIFLGIGSNLPSKFGNRLKNIILATSYLKQNNIEIVKQSSFYETFAYPNRSDPKFINIVISVKTKLPISELMLLLIKIEKKLERKRSKKNEPRTCDIDIIDYNGEVFNSEKLKITVPHKSMSSRNFVLYPLKEICPSWIHPLTKKNIDNLIKDLKISNNEITKLTQNDINNYVK